MHLRANEQVRLQNIIVGRLSWEKHIMQDIKTKLIKNFNNNSFCYYILGF